MTDLTMILDRIADRTATTADVDLLRRHPRVHGNRNVVQIGRSNINVREAGDIVVDNRAYYGHQADEIRAALATAFADPVGPLRGVGGVVITVGVLVGLAGFALFFYGLISTMGSGGIPSGPPPELVTGFGIAAAGAVINVLGMLIRGWQQPRDGR
jgi:hypothetical protein